MRGKMDKITISNLEIYSHHGVLKEENVLGQKFLISADLYTDIKKAGKTDEISCSINYAEVSHFIKKFMKENTFKLIEAVAEQMSEEIILAFPLIDKIVLTVKKPWAPILLPLDTVSVEVERGWHRAFLSIGSNIGDKKEHLDKAVWALKEDKKIRLEKVADYIVTKPYGNVEQDDFLNSAVSIKTLYTPQELLAKVGEIEQADGRERNLHWGPRTIDLDILLYENMIVEDENLVIPHREMHLRQFVLEPMAQIAPWVVHPVYGKTVQMLKDMLDTKSC